MHETAIAYSIVEQVIGVANANSGKKVTKVHIQVGQLRGIIPDQLQMSWQFVSRGSIAEKSDLFIETIPIEGLCQDCGEIFQVKDFEFRCPYCHRGQVKPVKGMELRLIDVEVEI